MIVSGEPVKSELLAQQPGQKLFDKMASSPEALAEEALALPAPWPTRVRCRWCATCRASTRWATRTSSSRATWSRAWPRTSRRRSSAWTRCEAVDQEEVRRRHGAGARDLHQPDVHARKPGAAPHLHGRARGVQDPGRAGRHAQARDQVGGRDRRRHHGRRHLDELPERRHPRQDARDEAGGAGPRHRHHQEELRSRRSRRASSSRTSTTSAWRCCRPRWTTTTSRTPTW